MNRNGVGDNELKYEWLLESIDRLFQSPLAEAHRRPPSKRSRQEIIDGLVMWGPNHVNAMVASRRSRIKNYNAHRKHRPPRRTGDAQRIAFAHDPALAQELREIIFLVNDITLSSVAVGHGGREGIIAAICLARGLLNRIPSQDLNPIIDQLTQLQNALTQMDCGSVHPALRIRQARGRPPNALRREFERRCVMASLFSRELKQRNVYELVHVQARWAAVLVGFQRPKTNRREPNSDGQAFTPTTIAKWVKRHQKTIRVVRQRDGLREWRDPRSEPSEVDDQEEFELAQLLGKVAQQQAAFFRGLEPGALLRSMDEIQREMALTAKATSAGA